jgi:hypothetical protein
MAIQEHVRRLRELVPRWPWVVPTRGSYDSQEEKIFDATRWIATAIIAFAVVGIVGVSLWSFGQARAAGVSRWTIFLQNIGLYGLIACAAGAAGALFGFLFAIPRTREAASVAGRTDDPTAVKQAVLVANTNLERVSDWLTTLLLGATLVQIQPLAVWVSNLGTCMLPACNPVTPILVIYYLVLGFLGTYLITRLYLTYALERTLSMVGVLPSTITEDLQRKLTEAISSGNKDQIDQALAAFLRQSEPEIANDPRLNLLVARAASKRIAADQQIDAARKNELQKDIVAAIKKAKGDPAVKAEANARLTDFEGLDANVRADIENELK